MAARRRTRSASKWGRLDPRREIELHYITDGPARGWVHTHGLAEHGKPELEIRNVPGFLSAAACDVLNDFSGYLLNEATTPLLAGQLVSLGPHSILVAVAHPDESAGYERSHYDGCVRLTLIDAPSSPCDCAECRRELAQRPRQLS
jgi:hypothetical protein